MCGAQPRPRLDATAEPRPPNKEGKAAPPGGGQAVAAAPQVVEGRFSAALQCGGCASRRGRGGAHAHTRVSRRGGAEQAPAAFERAGIGHPRSSAAVGGGWIGHHGRVTTEDWRAVLQKEFAAEPGSFLLALRCDLRWDHGLLRRLMHAMEQCCRPLARSDSVERWLAEGFWYLFTHAWAEDPARDQIDAGTDPSQLRLAQ
jgi:hypothetical protein